MNTAQQRGRPIHRILVTGGAGFIGSHSVDLLLAQGKEVVVLDNLSSGKLDNLNLQHPDVEFIEGDVLEYPFLEELVSSCDAVLHLAALVSVPASIEHPIFSFQVNTQGFLHVLQAAHKAPHPVRVVHASSAAVYGNITEFPCREDLPLSSAALSPYALQKIHTEDYAKLYLLLHGIKSLSLRYFNVYGSRQDPSSPYSGVISRFINAYKKGEQLSVYGDGMQSRDFIHVSDVARANWLALENDYTGALNIATGKPTTLLQVIEYLNIGREAAKVQFLPPRTGDIRESYAATQMAEKHIGFKASIPPKQGLINDW
jgi:UDP-glucose 4-epimerase